MSNATRNASLAAGRFPAWGVGVLAFVMLTIASFWNYYPPLPERMRLTVIFDSPQAGGSEPLIVTGQRGSAEFLYVKYVDSHTAVFGYDVWGAGGPTSAPVHFEPGQRHTLDVQFPALARVVGNIPEPSERLLLSFDGVRLLDAPAGARVRRPQRVWFGENPAEGSSCGRKFSGRLIADDGRTLNGSPRVFMTRGERFGAWLAHARWQGLSILVASALVAWAWNRRTSVLRAALDLAAQWRVHTAFLITAAICLAAFALLVNWPAAWPPYPNRWGSFYDYQALSFLQGRLDVPADAIYSEAFYYRGKIYGYFGPTPALLRLPFVIYGIGFGELTRAALVAYFAGCLVAAYLLLCHAAVLVRPTHPRPPTWMVTLFIAHIGLGSSLFFLGNRAQVFHEAILCGAMFALFTCWCGLRHLATPTGRWWLGALVCGVLAVHARPPTGLFALAFVGSVAAVLAIRERRTVGVTRALARPLALGVGSMLGFATFNAVSYLKFERFEGLPLKYHSQYPPERMAKVGHKGLHLINLPHGFYTYLVRPNLHFEARFPWVYAESRTPRHVFAGTFTELPDPTVPITIVMPALCLLAWGATAWAAMNGAAARVPVTLYWAALTPMALVMFAAIGSTHRYTADFCPFLIGVSAFGLAGLAHASRWLRIFGLTVVVALTAWVCVLTPVLALHTQGESDWIPPEAATRYQALRTRIDGWFKR